jgi:gas vesicle protein
MTDNPDEIRSDIERTRRELGRDVDALGDKVTPSHVMHRQADKVKHAFGSAKDRVMGVASDAKDAMVDASDAVTDAPHTVARQTQGNPIAVGLIAFGVGWLAASMLPASRKEAELASSIKDSAQPLVEEAKEAAMAAADDLRQPAQDAAQAVKDTASEAMQNVKDEAQGAAGDISDRAAEAKHAVQDDGM